MVPTSRPATAMRTGSFSMRLKNSCAGAQQPQKNRSQHARKKPQHHKPRQLRDAGKVVIGHLIPKTQSKKTARQHRRHHRRTKQRREQVHRKIAQHDVRRENRPRDRRVVGRRHPRRRPARHQQPQPIRLPARQLPPLRGRRGRKLRDASFPSDGRPRADAHQRRNRPDHSHPERQPPVPGHHHFQQIGRLVSARKAHSVKQNQTRSQPPSIGASTRNGVSSPVATPVNGWPRYFENRLCTPSTAE